MVEYRLTITKKVWNSPEETPTEETLLVRPTSIFREDGKPMDSVTPEFEYKVILGMADDMARVARDHFSKILGEEQAKKMFVRSFITNLIKDMREILDNDIEKLSKEGGIEE